MLFPHVVFLLAIIIRCIGNCHRVLPLKILPVMKEDKKPAADQIEKEMKQLIKKLNNENAALGKILLKMGEKREDREKPPGSKRKKKTDNQLGNQHSTE